MGVVYHWRIFWFSSFSFFSVLNNLHYWPWCVHIADTISIVKTTDITIHGVKQFFFYFCCIKHYIFWYFADHASQYIYLNINQLDALNFIMSLFHASTCFEHKCDDTRDCIVQFWPPDDEHLCSKHVEAWNKLIIKFSASSWLILR